MRTAAELLDLSGRTAVVTGGAMGIGEAIADRLHQAGANVVIADPGEQRLAVSDRLNGIRPGSALALDVNVADPENARAMVDDTVDRFGSLEILVNDAGIYPNCPILELDLELWRRVIDVNLGGLFLCTQAAARQMVAQGAGGRIVNITSIDALHPSMVGLPHYDASKHGAWGFTKSAALEFAEHDIQVNAIAPGAIRTPGVGEVDPQTLAAFEALIPMGRMGDSDEIARAALFLSSDLCGYTTGSQLVIDGGRLLR